MQVIRTRSSYLETEAQFNTYKVSVNQNLKY